MSDTPNVNHGPVTTVQSDSPQPEAQGTSNADTPAEARERRRIVLQEYADDDEVVMIVNGKEQVVPMREYRRNAQRDKSADARYREAAEKERLAYAQAEAFRNDLNDPERFFQALSNLNLDPREFARRLIDYEQREASLTPEQRKLRDYERQIQSMRSEQEQAQQIQQEREVAANEHAISQRFNWVLDQMGIPQEETLARGKLISELAHFALHVRTNERRDPTLAESMDYLDRVLRSSASAQRARQKPEDVIDQLTPEMVAEWQKKQAVKRPTTIAEAPKQASNQREMPPRNPQTGQFQSVTGQRVVTSIYDVLEQANRGT